MELDSFKGDEKLLGIYLHWIDYTKNNFTVSCTLTKGATVRPFIKRFQDEPGKGAGRGLIRLISRDDLFGESQILVVDDVLTLEFEVTIIDKHSSTFIKTNSF